MVGIKQTEPVAEGRALLPGMRRLLVVAGVLVFLAGVQLFVFTEKTDRYFAWTIDPPLTAAFLGASYWASVVLEWTAARERLWERARVAVPAVFVFTSLTMVATLLHLDKFHIGDAFPSSTQIVTWAWIAIYGSVPVIMVVLAVLQRRVGGSDGPSTAPLPAWMRATLALHAVIMLGLGAALFIAPESTAGLWPWLLTPLTGRAVGAWLLGIGVAAAHSAQLNDYLRVRAATLSYAALGLLHLAAVARYPDDMRWGSPSAWIYLAVIVSALLIGLYSWSATRRL